MTLKRILLPTDFSDTADPARGHAQELAERVQASLHLLHVIADPVSQDWAGGAGARVDGPTRAGRGLSRPARPLSRLT